MAELYPILLRDMLHQWSHMKNQVRTRTRTIFSPKILLSLFDFLEDEFCFVIPALSSIFSRSSPQEEAAKCLKGPDFPQSLNHTKLLGVAPAGEVTQAGGHQRHHAQKQSPNTPLWVSFCTLFSGLATVKSYTHIVQ